MSAYVPEDAASPSSRSRSFRLVNRGGGQGGTRKLSPPLSSTALSLISVSLPPPSLPHDRVDSESDSVGEGGGGGIPRRFFENIPRCIPDDPSETTASGEPPLDSWRAKDRKMKTLSIGIVLCLNIGVAPPDAVRTQPCAKLECWTDPASMPPLKAMEVIGNKLVAQYLRWQPKAKCRQSLDPTLDDMKRICTSLRRRAKVGRRENRAHGGKRRARAREEEMKACC